MHSTFIVSLLQPICVCDVSSIRMQSYERKTIKRMLDREIVGNTTYQILPYTKTHELNADVHTHTCSSWFPNYPHHKTTHTHARWETSECLSRWWPNIQVAMLVVHFGFLFSFWLGGSFYKQAQSTAITKNIIRIIEYVHCDLSFQTNQIRIRHFSVCVSTYKNKHWDKQSAYEFWTGDVERGGNRRSAIK